ncbi:MAG: DNA recombination protein RmuC [Acidobacteriaceae bacterium]
MGGNIMEMAVLVAGLGLGLGLGWWLGKTQATGALRSLLAGKDAELASKTAELAAKNTEIARLDAGQQGRDAALDALRKEKNGLIADLATWKKSAETLAEQDKKHEAEIAGLREEKSALEKEKTQTSAQLKAAQQSLENDRALLDQAKKDLTDTFKALAAETLQGANKQFLGLATEKFDAKQQAIDSLLQPVKETLGKLNEQTQQLEVKREGAYREVLAQVANIQKTHEGLRQETNQLVQALRAPKARGNWGELQLQRCMEFAGMVEHCSYDTEVFMRTGEDAAQRPDAVIHLPNGRNIVVDAKTPLDAFLSAMSATDETERVRLLQTHAAQVRTHLKQLSGKQYWQTLKDSPDFVVCFLPSEVLFSAALEQDPDLIEFGSRSDVVLATPTTLIALLKAVAYGWQQMEITRNAIAVRDIAAALYDKLAKAQEHFVKMGKALASSVTHYNNLVGTVEGRGGVFTQSRKLRELGVGADELPEVKEVESPVRQLQNEDWQMQDAPSGLALAAEAEDDTEGGPASGL